MIFVWLIVSAWRWVILISCEIISFAVAYAWSPSWKLAGIGVESQGTFRIIIFESFGFGEEEAEFGGWVVCKVFLYILMGKQWDFVHFVNFIINS